MRRGPVMVTSRKRRKPTGLARNKTAPEPENGTSGPSPAKGAKRLQSGPAIDTGVCCGGVRCETETSKGHQRNAPSALERGKVGVAEVGWRLESTIVVTNKQTKLCVRRRRRRHHRRRSCCWMATLRRKQYSVGVCSAEVV